MASPLGSVDIFQTNTITGNLYPGVPSPVTTYAGPAGSFDATNTFRPSPETSRLLDYLKNKSGKNITVEPFSAFPGGPESFPPSTYGVYFDKAPRGGSSDPTTRTVYLNEKIPGSNLAVLSHELGHALDPNLPREYAAYGSSFPARARMLGENTARRNPVGFLNTFILGPEVKVRLETEAQRAGAQNLRDIGYPTKQFTEDTWYKGYPGSFVDTGLDQAATLYSLPQNVPQGIPSMMMDTTRNVNFGAMGGGLPSAFIQLPSQGPDNPEIDFTDEVARNMLNLALNNKYRQTEDLIRSRNKEYIDSRLGR